MRCSKCGYISFDHLDSCRKCHKPIADAGFKGTACAAAVPLFLQFSEEMDVVGHEEELVDILDPDLSLLADDGADEEIDFGAGNDEIDIAFDAEGDEKELSLDEDDLFLDTSRFEEVPVNVRAAEAARPLQLEIPEELADISDLARPDLGPGQEAGREMTAGSGDDLDDELDFADLDLADLDLPVAEQKAGKLDFPPAEDDFADLFLDDMDLSGDLAAVIPPALSSPVEDDLDLDLDLDLGALGSKDERPQKRKADDFSDLSLSLE